MKNLKTEDNVFGTIEYKYSWIKKEEVYFLGREYFLTISVQAYKGDEILDSQRENYKKSQDMIKDNEETIKNKLTEYCKSELSQNSEELLDVLTPQKVIFERDNSWGILFDYKYDIENGVGLFFINHEIKVDIQEVFL